MVELIVEAARNARQEARRLRSDSAELMLVMRSRIRCTERQTAAAQEATATLRAQSAIPLASPWSGLHWLLDDESLERVLLPLD